LHIPPTDERQKPAQSRTALCTLFEGDYHYGLAALANSLLAAGYQGDLWVGYRGLLPPWLNQLEQTRSEPAEYSLNGRIRLLFVPLQTPLHLTNYKPQFLERIFTELAPELDYLWYFDPDICVEFPWSFFTTWQQYGIAICEERSRFAMPATDPIRLQWIDLGRELQLGDPRPCNSYYNGGLLGLGRAQMDLLQLWKQILDAAAERKGLDLNRVYSVPTEHPFHMQDQDALNMALLFSSHFVSALGPEAMGFIPGWNAMFHAVQIKPWRINFLTSALYQGIPPNTAMKSFLGHVAGPIRPYAAFKLRRLRLSAKLASFIGRFYRCQ